MNSGILNVRQISQYPSAAPLDPGDLMLLQRGGLGGAYYSAQVSDFISAALSSPNPVIVSGTISVASLGLPPTGVIGWGTDPTSQSLYGPSLRGALAFSPSVGWRFDYASPQAAVTVARITPSGDIVLPFGTVIVARNPAAPNEVATRAYVDGCSVSSFNGRRGDVCLLSSDIYNALNLYGTVASEQFVEATICASLSAFYRSSQLVYTFNSRSGYVILNASDITAACTASGAEPQSNTPPSGDNSTAIATTAFVNQEIAGALVTYAPLASPAFSGVPTAPTANPGTNTGQLATTAFVQAAITESTTGVASFNGRTGAVTLLLADVTDVGGAPSLSPIFTGSPTAPTAAPGTSTTQLATTAFVMAALSTAGGVSSFNGRAGAVTLTAADVSGSGAFASPAFTGTPVAPTPVPGNSTTQIATTAFVTAAIGASVTAFNGRTGSVTLVGSDVSAAGGALISSPTFTGTPSAPTAAPGTSTTQLATTAFVTAALSAGSVTSFNGRNGAVTLTGPDITGAGGALLSSPTFTGVPLAPTAAPGVSTTQIATTAFVANAVAAAGGVTTFNTRSGAVTLGLSDITGAGGAPLASPAFTGTPAAPTATAGTSTTQIATTAFVAAAITAGATPGWTLSLAGQNSTIAATGTSPSIFKIGAASTANYVIFTNAAGGAIAEIQDNSSNSGANNLNYLAIRNGISGQPASLLVGGIDANRSIQLIPTGTGTVQAPTMAPGTNSTALATTAFVTAAIGAYLPLAGGTLTGNLTVSLANPDIVLNKTGSGQTAQISGRNSGSNRWVIELGSGSAESGSNVGSDLSIDRCSDAGTFLDSPLVVVRSTGHLALGDLANGTIYGNTEVSIGCNSTYAALTTQATAAGNFYGIVFHNSAGANSGVISGNDTTVNYGTSSDARLKSSSDQEFTGGRELIDQLVVRSFTWLVNRTQDIGLVAQEAHPVYPSAVMVGRGEPGEVDFMPWSVDYSKYVPLLIQALQEALRRIDALEAAT